MLTHQLSLKESICEKNFLQLVYIKIAVAPISFLPVSNSLILVNYKKCIFRILQILLTAGFIIYYYEIYSHSFISNKISVVAATNWSGTTASKFLHSSSLVHQLYVKKVYFCSFLRKSNEACIKSGADLELI